MQGKHDMRFGNTRVVQKVPAVTAGAYSAGNVVGGPQLIGPPCGPFNRGVLKSVSVVDAANQKAALTILYFKALPTGTWADHGAPAPSAADVLSFVGKVEVAAADYTTVGTKAFATVSASLAVKAGDTGELYAVAVTPGTPTYAATDNLTFTHGLLCD